jgi:hypothetical protein
VQTYAGAPWFKPALSRGLNRLRAQPSNVAGSLPRTDAVPPRRAHSGAISKMPLRYLSHHPHFAPLEAASPRWDGPERNLGKRQYMSSSTRIIRALLLAAAAVALAAAAYQLREKHQEAELTVQDIHDQLDALDPVTRAAVVARLTSDEVQKVRSR